jgi:hypothetical protein
VPSSAVKWPTVRPRTCVSSGQQSSRFHCLLDSGFESLQARLMERQREEREGENIHERLSPSATNCWRTLMSIVFPAMVGNRGGAAIERVLRKLLVELVREDVRAVALRGRAGPVPLEAIRRPSPSSFARPTIYVWPRRSFCVPQHSSVFDPASCRWGPSGAR